MRRPVWILSLLLALAVASAFAWLGQWQMGSAIRTDNTETINTEEMRPIDEVDTLGKGVTDEAAGVLVSTSGRFVAGDSRIIAPRTNDGRAGAWVVGHLVSGEGAGETSSLAVAIGWAPSVEDAERALAAVEADPGFAKERRLEGRYMPPDGPEVPKPDEDPQTMHTMLAPALANSWSDTFGPVRSGYLVLHPEGAANASLLESAALDAIDSVPPLPPEKVNWLNVFYAIEWIVFAGFAIFFWFRLTRDAWEKEHELQLLEAEEAARAAAGPDPDRSVDADADPAAAAQAADQDHSVPPSPDGALRSKP
ncbi:hypothetical protein JD292_01330 [Leucobacter sp. CSA2]|uniref:SURF1-like protein n=2 Tax=Leucobacter edaphi TaxID=2796472 RepID=A0A934UWX8_9MICO|nr:hypothetical protein [Leucobacter edaphi]